MIALSAAQGALERLDAAQLPRPVDRAAADQLAGLEIATETGPDGYDRGRFGTGWDVGDDGCDTRHRVLRDASVTPVVLDGCTVLSGEWRSLYDTTSVTDPAALDIDHLVALAEAWASGARDWTDEQRQAFANDLDRPDALVAVTASTNRAKGDSDPAEWLPPDPAVHCWYAQAWIAQKAAWRLSVDPAEQQALAAILAGCPPDQPEARP